MGDMTEKSGGDKPPVVIKKYANRRLYNTATSSYVTLDDLSRMVKGGDQFVVYDAKTSEDITRPVLIQIIVEEEQKGQNLLPISFLQQLIGLYGGSMQWLVPRYLAQPGSNAQEPSGRFRRAVPLRPPGGNGQAESGAVRKDHENVLAGLSGTASRPS
jgi:polyhydroxyalkanoate synthesis repressor PhaR